MYDQGPNELNRTALTRVGFLLTAAAVVALLVCTGCRPRPDGLRSVSTSKQTQLPNHGGGGGSEFEFNCGPNEVLTGARGTEGRGPASLVIKSLEFQCRELHVLGVPGHLGATSATFGGTSGDPFDGTCALEEMINGIHGNSYDRLDGFGPYCATLNEVMDGVPIGQPLHANEVGPFGGSHGPEHFWDDVCPPGYVGTGDKGRAGAAIDAISLRCSKIESSNLKNGCVLDDDKTFSFPRRGSRSLSYVWRTGNMCPPGAVVTGFQGRVDSDTFDGTPTIGELQLVCRSFDACDEGVDGVVHVTPPHGARGAPFEGECPPNTVVDRVFGRAGGVLDNIGLYCGTIEDALGGYSRYPVGPFGGNGGHAFDDKCPPGYVVTGANGTFHEGVGGISDFDFRCTKIEEVPIIQP